MRAVEHPDPSPSASVEQLYVLCAPPILPPEMQKAADLWLASPDRPDAAPDSPRPVTVRLKSATVQWRPGRAILQSAPGSSESFLSALIDFAFFESELRRLERYLLPYEASAPADVALAYRIRKTSRSEWDRLGQTMEGLSLMRLAFAVIQPHLVAASRSLDSETRRFAARLIVRSGMPERLESFSSRLETCEDLYEGAVDRITDFRGYHKGFALETIIIVLLVLELIAMILQLIFRL